MNDHQITIREVSYEVGISTRSCHNILSNILDMKRVVAKFVPKLLNFQQEQQQMEVVQKSLN